MVIFEKLDTDSIRVNEVIDKFLVAMFSRKHYCSSAGHTSQKNVNFESEVLLEEKKNVSKCSTTSRGVIL